MLTTIKEMEHSGENAGKQCVEMSLTAVIIIIPVNNSLYSVVHTL